jgi:hypothetical protein
MLGTGARYAEYGITGGFFLFTQALILWLAYPDVVSGAHSFGVQLNAIVDEIPKEARPAIQSLLVALALLSVFIIGLVLEIIGSIFIAFEAIIFRKRLAMNQWVAKFVEAELPDYAEDYRLFLDQADLWSQVKEQWKPKNLKEQLKPKNWFRLRGRSGGIKWQSFRRLESVLIAKVLTSGAKTEMLAEQISICRMSRAIGIALYVVSFEFLVGSGVFGEILSVHEQTQAILAIIGFLILVLSHFISLGAYSRFVNMLLSLVYASWKPQTASLAAAPIKRPSASSDAE